MNPNNDNSGDPSGEFDFMDRQPKHTCLTLFILLTLLCVGIVGISIQNTGILVFCISGSVATSLLWMIS